MTKLLSLLEVAEGLGRDIKTVRRWVKAKKFPVVRLTSRGVMVKEKDYEDLIQPRTVTRGSK